jgi:hypothetical protein
MHADALLAAEVPRWIWAALVIGAFVGVTVLTIVLARYPLRRVPPPVAHDEANETNIET